MIAVEVADMTFVGGLIGCGDVTEKKNRVKDVFKISSIEKMTGRAGWGTRDQESSLGHVGCPNMSRWVHIVCQTFNGCVK